MHSDVTTMLTTSLFILSLYHILVAFIKVLPIIMLSSIKNFHLIWKNEENKTNILSFLFFILSTCLFSFLPTATANIYLYSFMFIYNDKF